MKIEIIEDKVNEIFEKSNLVKNLARRKLLIKLIMALFLTKNINFSALSLHINKGVKVSSSLRRIQRFFAQIVFDELVLARFLLSFFPESKLTLCIDRTNWKFGKFSRNILMLTVYFNGIGLPFFWVFLDNKGGNSATQDRIDLLQKCLTLLGAARIKHLIADREFIGIQWFTWLKEQKIPFCIRLPKSHKIHYKGQSYKVADLLKDRDLCLLRGVVVGGVKSNIYAKKLQKDSFLLLAGTGYVKKLGEIYRKRWSIEVCFKAFKTHGFNLENTHLQDTERLYTLLALLSIAVSFCVKLGYLLHTKREKIKLKKHGYKAKSFFREGLDTWQKIFLGLEQELIFYVNLFLLDLKKYLQKCYVIT